MCQFKKQALWMISAFLMSWLALTPSAHAQGEPSIQAPYAVVINADTGEVLYSKASHHKAYPASITKLMTVLLMEKYMKTGDVITATPEAVAQYPSNWFYRMHLGETMSKQDALYALMITSSNDVAMAVAQHVGGSEAGFAKMMNQEAQNLGLKESHFVTPNGLHDPNHYTTPYDMAKIAKALMAYPEVFQAMRANTYILNTDKQTAEIYRRDKINDNPLAFGGKTGFTDQAGQTIVEYEKKGNNRIIAVVMKDNDYGEYPDVQAISQYAFARMKTMEVGRKKDPFQTIQVNGQMLPVQLDQTTQISYEEGDQVDQSIKWLDQKKLSQGVKKGQLVGTLSLSVNGHVQKQVHLVATESIPGISHHAAASTKPAAMLPVKNNNVLLFGVFLFLVLGYFLLKPREIQKKDQTRV